MSTVVFKNGIRVWVNAKEAHHKGRPHCHIEGRGGEAVIDLVSLEVLHVDGYSPKDVRQIVALIKTFHDEIMDQWKEYHG